MSNKEKRLRFPSMDDPDDDDSKFYYQNDDDDDDSDSNSDSESLLNELFSKNDRGEYVPYKPNDFEHDSTKLTDSDTEKDKDIRAGELEAYNRAKEIISEGEGFQYFPDDATEENNQRFSMAHLKPEWGGDTQKNIGIARFFFKTFLNENLKREAEHTGIASHYLMVIGFHKAALQAEKFGKQMMSGESETGLKGLRFKGMGEVAKKKLAERCRDLAGKTFHDCKNAIIKKEGAISHE